MNGHQFFLLAITPILAIWLYRRMVMWVTKKHKEMWDYYMFYLIVLVTIYLISLFLGLFNAI